MTLGHSFSTDKNSLIGTKCLKDLPKKLIGSSSSIISFSDAVDGSYVAKDLGLGFEAEGVVYPLILGSAGFTYAKYVQDNNYSKTFNFVYKVEFGSYNMIINEYGTHNLNEFGVSAYEIRTQAFREACGDKFVVQEKLGAKLYLSMKLNFASICDKMSFSLSVGGKLDLLALTIDIKLKYKQMIEQQNLNFNLEIAAYQEGGNVLSLSNIFSKTKQGEYNLMNCDAVSNIDACIETLQGVLNYAKSDFAKQIHYDQGIVNGDYAVVNRIYQEYAALGLRTSKSAITPEIIEIRNMMLSKYANFTKTKDFINNLLYHSEFPKNNNQTAIDEPGYKEFGVSLATSNIEKYWNDFNKTTGYWTWNPQQIFTAERFSLKESLNIVNSNLMLLDSSEVGIPGCFNDPDLCSKKNIDNLVDPDYRSINFFKKSYQIIAVCDDNKPYGRYFLPIARDIYQEKSKFIIMRENTTSEVISSSKIKISHNNDQTINLDLFSNELDKKSSNCQNHLSADSSFDGIALYRAELGNDNICAKAMCGFASEKSNLLGSISLLLIELDSPI